MVTVTPVVAADGRRSDIAMLSPLAVDPSRHGQGIGSELVRSVLARGG